MHSAAILNRLTNPHLASTVVTHPHLTPIVFSFLDDTTLALTQRVNRFFKATAQATLANKITTDFQDQKEKERKVTITCFNTLTGDGMNSIKRFQIVFHDEGNRKTILPVLNVSMGRDVEFKLNNLDDFRNPKSFYVYQGYENARVCFALENDSSKSSFKVFKRSMEPIKNRLLVCPEEKMINAIEKGDVKELKEYLDKDISANTTDKHGKPLILLAALKGHVECVEMLLDKKANVDARDPASGATTLMLVVHGIAHMTKEVVDSYQDEKDEGLSAKLIKLFELLISRKANVNAQSKLGQTLLHYLSAGRNPLSLELAKYFLEKGADPCIVNGLGLRPACVEGDYNRSVSKFLYITTMPKDAVTRIDSVVFSLGEETKEGAKEQYCYTFTYKGDLAEVDRRFAWEAIVNTLKSISIQMTEEHAELKKDELLGLANDYTACYFEKDKRGGQVADTKIPSCSDYAIQCIDYKDEHTFVILIKPKYSMLPVHKAILDALKTLQLYVENKTLRSEFDGPLKPEPAKLLPVSEVRSDASAESIQSGGKCLRLTTVVAGAALVTVGLFALYKQLSKGDVSSVLKNSFRM